MSQDLNRLPPQTKYIVGNEAAERLSFYAMRALLTVFIAKELFPADPKADPLAESIYHYFNMAIYFLPLAGAWIADRLWGRYRTILLVSLGYCVGHGLLAASEFTHTLDARRFVFFAGLAFIALGAGGIKPCVSAFVGDQFTGGREHLLPRIYSIFYWSINFGSFFGVALLPKVRDHYGYAWAFGIPGVFMALATFIFWLGRKTYIKRPPMGEQPSPPKDMLQEDRRTIGRIVLIFAPILVFWSLFDQTGSTWVQQGKKMTDYSIGWLWGYQIDAESIQSLNPLLVMILIPICSRGLYPLLAWCGIEPTPLRRMGTGMIFAAMSFVAAAWLQQRVDGGQHLSILWQLLPYTILTIGEVFLSITGLEFAFSQAPARLKSTIMSLWYVSVALGNLLAGTVAQINAHLIGGAASMKMLFYAGLMLVVAGIFALIARRFKAAPVKM
jgi:POT family proton-dependent oligopeptide transporter